MSPIKRMTASFFFVAVIISRLPVGFTIEQSCPEGTQEVNDIAFEFRNECSMTVSWEAPECRYPVANYTVQSALRCPSNWTNKYKNTTFFKTEDIKLITSCLNGDCYIRIAAELDRPEYSQTVVSHCYVLSDTFYASYMTRSDVEYLDQHVCIPVTATCPSRTVPNFIVNERMIAWPFGSTGEDDIYITNNRLLCIRNTESDTIVVHEVCHIDPNCNLCPPEDGEFQLMHRTEVHSTAEITVTGNRSLSTEVEDIYCAPCVANLCSTNNTYMADVVDENFTVPTICICLPFYDVLRNRTTDNILVELNLTLLYTSTYSGEQNTSTSIDVNVPLTNSTYCISDINLTMKDNQVTNDMASLRICLTILGSSGIKSCAQTQEKCTYSLLEIINGKDASTTLSTILAVFILLSYFALCTAAVVLLVIYVKRKRSYIRGVGVIGGNIGHVGRGVDNVDCGKSVYHYIPYDDETDSNDRVEVDGGNFDGDGGDVDGGEVDGDNGDGDGDGGGGDGDCHSDDATGKHSADGGDVASGVRDRNGDVDSGAMMVVYLSETY